MKRQYYRDREIEINRFKVAGTPPILTPTLLSKIPRPMQVHFQKCGFVGKPLAMNADVIWQESFLKLKSNQRWRALDTLQFNSVKPLMRTSHMQVKKMFFAGKDLYKEGRGSMIGKVLKYFKVLEAGGPEISQSALITIFCELMLLPGYVFQDNVSFVDSGENWVKVRLSDHNMTVTGVFHFNDEGLFHYFESDDRYFDMGNGKFEKKKFMSRIDAYKMVDGHCQPKEACVLWVLDDGPYKYFRGTIANVTYNVTI